MMSVIFTMPSMSTAMLFRLSTVKLFMTMSMSTGMLRRAVVWVMQELGAGSIDLGFVDADKDNYDTYVEQLLVLLRPGGVLVVDNVLWGGSVLDDSDQTADTKVIPQLCSSC